MNLYLDIEDEEPIIPSGPDTHLTEWIRTYRSDRNLSSALSDSFQRFILRNWEKPQLQRRLGSLLSEYGGRQCLQYLQSPRVQAWRCIWETVKQVAPGLKNQQIQNWVRSLVIASAATQIQAKRYGGIPDVDVEKIITYSPIRELLRPRYWYDKVITRVSRSVERSLLLMCGTNRFQFWEEYLFFDCALCGQPHLCNYTDFLCASDVNGGRIDVLLYSMYRDLLEGTKTTPTVTLTLMHMDVLFHDFGTHVYHIFKAIPSLATGAVLQAFDPLDGGEFISSLVLDLETKIMGLKDHPSFRFLYRRPLTSDQAIEMLEISGLWKMAGHPTVDIEAGIQKVIDTGYYHKAGLADIAEKIACCVRYLYCYHYFQQHGKWPAADVTYADPIIRKSYHRNVWPETYGTFQRLHLSCFKNVLLQKSQEFDMHPDLSELISDTSINPGLSHWHYESTPDWMHNVEYGRYPTHKLPRMRKNRPILVYLEEQGISLQQVINVIESGVIPDEWTVITLVAKERELKLEARFFAKNTYEVRLWQVSTEKAIAQILDILPYQSMTMSNDRLQHRLINMSKGLNQTQRISQVVLILDFSSWNLQFRHNTIGPVLEDLDRIYGFRNVFSYTHLHPMRSKIFVKDPGRPIEEDPVTGHPLVGARCYLGQESYFEGLRQKGWTIHTIGLIQTVAKTFSYRVELLGQGDNQAIILSIPEKYQDIESAKSYARLFRQRLTEFSNQAQIPMKAEETWMSSILFEYGRTSFFRGAQVPSSLKKASRLETEPNNSLSSLSVILNNCYSGGVSIASLDKHPAPAYFLSTYAALHVMRRYVPRWYKEENPKCILGKLLVPAEVGGLVSTTYESFCMRGCADPLTRAITLMRILWQQEPELRPYMAPFIRVERVRNPDFTLLLQDPTCLALNKPPTSENYLRNLLKPVIRSTTQNPQAQALFSTETEAEESRLVHDLQTIVPRNARLLSTLYSLSNPALANRFIGKFTSPISVVHTAANVITTMPDLWKRIAHHDKLWVQYYSVSPDNTPSLDIRLTSSAACSCDVADWLRTSHWGPLEGVTMPSPFEQVRLIAWDKAIQSGLTPIMSISLHAPTGHDPLSQIGPYEPFIGHDTEEKISKNPLDLGRATSITRSAIRLTSLIPWICSDPDTNLRHLFVTLLKEKGVDITEALEKIQPLYTRGSLYHRLADPFTSHGCRVNATPVFASNVVLNSDRFSAIISGGNDQTFFFQEVKAWVLCVLRHLFVMNRMESGDYALVFKCKGCTRLIQEVNPQLPSPPLYQGVSLPVDPGVISPRVREIVPFSVPSTEYPEAFSWAMASLASALFMSASLSERTGNTLVGTATHISHLRRVSPQEYLYALLLRLHRLQREFRGISSALLPFLGHDAEVGQGRVPLLVSNLEASGLLVKLFGVASFRPSAPNWTRTLKAMTSTFICMIGTLLRKPLNHTWVQQAFVFLGEPSWTLADLEGLCPHPVISCPHAESVVLALKDTVEIPISDPVQPCQVSLPCLPVLPAMVGTSYGSPSWTSYHYLARSLGIESCSMSKILEALAAVPLPQPPRTVISLAEGDGGILCLLGHLYPEAALIYNSLQSEIRPAHRGMRLAATLYSDPCNVIKRVIGFDELFYGISDISNPNFYTKLEKLVSMVEQPFLITCDANVTPVYNELHTQLVTWIQQYPSSMFIIKHMATQGDYPAPGIYRSHHVKVVFPWASNPITGECYLVGVPGEGPLTPIPQIHQQMLDNKARNLDSLDRCLQQYGRQLYDKGVPSCFNWPEAFIRSMAGDPAEVIQAGSIIPFLRKCRKEHRTWLTKGQLTHLTKLSNQLVPSGCKAASRISRLMRTSLDTLVMLDYYLLVLEHFPRSPRELLPGLAQDDSVRLYTLVIRQNSRHLYRYRAPARKPKEIIVRHYYSWKEVSKFLERRVLRLYTFESFLRGMDILDFQQDVIQTRGRQVRLGGIPSSITGTNVDEYDDVAFSGGLSEI